MPVEHIKYAPGKTMQVEIVAPTRLHGIHYETGRQLEIPEQHGWELVGAGKARRVVVVEAQPQTQVKLAR